MGSNKEKWDYGKSIRGKTFTAQEIGLKDGTRDSQDRESAAQVGDESGKVRGNFLMIGGKDGDESEKKRRENEAGGQRRVWAIGDLLLNAKATQNRRIKTMEA